MRRAQESAYRERLMRVVARISARLDRHVDAMIEQYRNETSFYATLPSARLRHDVRETSLRHVTVLLGCLAESRTPTARERESLAELGTSLFQQGVPMPALLDAYWIGAREMSSAVVTELLREDLDREDREAMVDRAGRDVMRLARQMMVDVQDAYAGAEREAGAQREREQREAVDDLLEGTLDVAAARERARSVDFSLGRAHVVVTIGPETGLADPRPEVLTRVADAARSAIAPRSARTLLVRRARVAIIVVALDHADNRPIKKVLSAAIEPDLERCSLVCGIGRAEPDYRGISTSFAQAMAVQALVRKGWGLPRVCAYEDAAVEAMMDDVPDRLRELVQDQIMPLLAQDHRSATGLLTLLEAYFECAGNQRRTAARLHIHPRTMKRGLLRIEAVTGRDLADRRDRLLLDLALVAYRVHVAGSHATTGEQ